MALLGILVPLAIAGYALSGYFHEAIWWPGKGGGVTLKGDSAKALALSYFGAAAAAHFRWFRGILPAYRIFTWGTTLSLVLWISGCGTAFYHEFL